MEHLIGGYLILLGDPADAAAQDGPVGDRPAHEIADRQALIEESSGGRL